MLTDYHCHVLPGIDDGAKDEVMSLAMLEMEKKQGVERIIATPHFYAHREASVSDFLEKRQKAFDSISGKSPIEHILLGTEVAVEHGISKLSDIEKLAIEGTNLILLELPYRGYEKWMSEEIYNISISYGLKVILAHIHRYCEFYSKAEMQWILKTDAYFQVNHDAFTNFTQRNYVRSLIRYEYPVVFGSDCHNLTDRKPDWFLAGKGRRADAIKKSNRLLDEHIRK